MKKIKSFLKYFTLLETISLMAGCLIYFSLKLALNKFPLERDIMRAAPITAKYPILFIGIFITGFSLIGSLWLKNFKRKTLTGKIAGIAMVIILSIFFSSGLCSLGADIFYSFSESRTLYLSNLVGSFGIGITFGSMLFILSAPLSILSTMAAFFILLFTEKVFPARWCKIETP